MKKAHEWMAKIPRDGHSFDYIDWVKDIQKDARQSIQVELDATREELKQAQIELDNWNATQ